MANQGSSSERGTSLLYLGLSLGAVAAGLRWKYHVDSWAAQAFSQVNICSSVSEAQNLGDGAYVLFQGRAENPAPPRCENTRDKRGYWQTGIIIRTQSKFFSRVRDHEGGQWRDECVIEKEALKAPPFSLHDLSTSSDAIQITEIPVERTHGVSLTLVSDDFLASPTVKPPQLPTLATKDVVSEIQQDFNQKLLCIPGGRQRLEWILPEHTTLTALGVVRKSPNGKFHLASEGKPYYLTNKSPAEVANELSNQGINYYYAFMGTAVLCGISLASGVALKAMGS